MSRAWWLCTLLIACSGNDARQAPPASSVGPRAVPPGVSDAPAQSVAPPPSSPPRAPIAPEPPSPRAVEPVVPVSYSPARRPS